MLVGLIFSRRDVQRVECRRGPLGSRSSDSSAHEVERVAELLRSSSTHQGEPTPSNRERH